MGSVITAVAIIEFLIILIGGFIIRQLNNDLDELQDSFRSLVNDYRKNGDNLIACRKREAAGNVDAEREATFLKHTLVRLKSYVAVREYEQKGLD